MNVEAVTPTGDIGSDLLFRVDGTYLLRARVQQTTPNEAILQSVEQAVEVVNFRFSCSLAKDESGDVKEDAAGRHLIFAAEVHGVGLEALSNGLSLESWIADTLEGVLAKATRKAFLVTTIAQRYALPGATA